MKGFFIKISAILLAFVVVFSTMSFTFSEHFCGDYLVDFGLFSKAESCGMESGKTLNNEACSIEKSNCCKDILQKVEGQSHLKNDVLKLNFNQQLFFVAFTYSYQNLFEGLPENFIPFKEYSPPFIVRDIQTLDEVFLI